MKYGKRTFWKRFKSSPLLLFVLIIVFGILAKAAWSIHSKAVASSLKLTQAQAELARLKLEENDLSAKVGYLSTPEGVEAELRTKFRAVKEGESVAVIIDRGAERDNVSTTSANGQSMTDGWFRKLLRQIGL